MSTPKIITPALQEVRKFARTHTDFFIQKNFDVVNRDGNVVPFKYNWSQQQVQKKIQEMRDAGKPVRIYVLKSRQVGISTQLAARFFTDIWAFDDLETGILSHQESTAQSLLDKCKFFNISMGKTNPGLLLPLAHDSRHNMKFADTRGNLTIASSKNIQALRGKTFQRFQFTEFSFAKNPTQALKELSQPIVYSPYTEIYIETTAFGHGSDAHDFWRKCKAGKSVYETIFLEWFKDPACTWTFQNDKHQALCMEEAIAYEPQLEDRMRYYKLTPGNLYYAYRVLKDQCEGDYDFYIQEYPCDDEEAWRSKGLSWFGNAAIAKIKTNQYPFEYKTFGVKAPLGQLFNSLDDLDQVKELDENESMPFIKLWKRPHPNGRYLVSSDSASGLESGDFTSSFVIDMNTLEMMAEFHGRIRPDENAIIIASLCMIYNSALAGPEYNTPGNATLQELKNYPVHIYRWRVLDDYKFKISSKLGWQTNSWSRDLMLNFAKRIVQDIANGNYASGGVIKSWALLDEMKTFVDLEGTGFPEASGRHNDDRVMAWAIALEIAKQETEGMPDSFLKGYGGKHPSNQPQMDTTNNPAYNVADPQTVIENFIKGQKNYGF